MPPTISFLPLGALIQSFPVAISPTSSQNILLNFPCQSLYAKHNSPHFGLTIGRVANRIANATIDTLNHQSYSLARNASPHCLHGGPAGWGTKIWTGPRELSPCGIRGLAEISLGMEHTTGEFVNGQCLEFTLRDEHNSEGFPGTVLARVIYTTGTQVIMVKEVPRTATVLEIEYTVELLDGAEETVVNLTNHSYFNLNLGSETTTTPSIADTRLALFTNLHLPLDSTGIPFSGCQPTHHAFIKPDIPFTLHAHEPVIDDCFITDPRPEDIPLDTRTRPLTLLTHASHPVSNIHLQIASTEPAFQLYTGDGINVPAVAANGECAPQRGPRSGFCVEPGRYVDAVNRPAWRGMVVLPRGKTWASRTVYRAWYEGD